MWSTHILENSQIFIFLVMGPLVLIGLSLLFAYIVGHVIPRFQRKRSAPRDIKEASFRDFPASAKAKLIWFVHEDTKASAGLCKRALEEVDYDVDKAIRLLHATSAVKEGHTLKHGRVFSFLYQEKVGVLVEVNCETEFGANTVDFGLFVQELAYQIAVTNPSTISRNIFGPVLDPFSSIPPPPPLEEGSVLLEQKSVLPDHKGKTVQQLLNDLSFRLREQVTVRRFARYEIEA